MSVLILSDGTRVSWEPTTELICMYCRESIDVADNPKHSMRWTNFMFDLLHPKETSLVLGQYWYFHKECMGIEDALMMRGAKIGWGWYDMKSVLGLDTTVWKQMNGNVQKMLQKSMPAGVYDHLYAQWLPALTKLRLVRSPQPKPLQKPMPKGVITRPPKIMKPQRDAKAGYVYLIEAIGSERIKIGRGRNAMDRLRSLATSSPYPLQMIREIPTQDYVGLEKALHTRYAPYRMHNEWFSLPTDVLLDLLKEQFT